MRAGFLGQNICALGFGIATLQAPRLVMDEPVQEPLTPPATGLGPEVTGQTGEHLGEKDTPATASVTNSQRLYI